MIVAGLKNAMHPPLGDSYDNLTYDGGEHF